MTETPASLSPRPVGEGWVRALPVFFTASLRALGLSLSPQGRLSTKQNPLNRFSIRPPILERMAKFLVDKGVVPNLFARFKRVKTIL